MIQQLFKSFYIPNPLAIVKVKKQFFILHVLFIHLRNETANFSQYMSTPLPAGCDIYLSEIYPVIYVLQENL